jgi:hypothetical protein
MLDRINERLADLHRGRPIIVATEAAAGATQLIEVLFGWGVSGVLVIAGARGAGALDERAELCLVETSGGTIMEGIRSFSRCLSDPPSSLLEAIDRFDPDGRASVITAPFETLRSLAGRKVLGARRPEWVALEDKTVVDQLWDATGVPRAPSSVVDVAQAAIVAEGLDRGDGTVWVADNSSGWHGGGEYTRWVRVADRAASGEWFAERASQVRVMPFLDGIPCSIHGYVTSEGVAAFRPVEMVILRRPESAQFQYAGFNTFWDPPPADRAAMRSAARATGRVLAERVRYRGPFSIDGILTPDGFRPTELNPRLSPGLLLQASTVTGLALGLLTRAFVDGDIDVDHVWLEELIVPVADRVRAGGMGLAVHGVRGIEDEVEVVFDGAGVHAVEDGEPADAVIAIGPTATGLYIRMRADSERVPHGPSLAPMAVAAAAFVEQRLGIEIGPLLAAVNVRS